MLKRGPAGKRLQFLPVRPAVAAGLAAILCASVFLLPARGADSVQDSVPHLMLRYDQGWSGFIAPGYDPNIYLPDDYLHGPASMERAQAFGVPADKVSDYLIARAFNEYIPPVSGIGPISDGPEHPFYNTQVSPRVIRKNPTWRIADLTSEAAKNLMPWAVEALKKQNALALAERNGETRQARCWETGVPDIHEAPQTLYFIQTPKEVVMYQGQRTRHVYMNVPHSKNPDPSWYGESVGHYEGDTLVVDTIGLNDKTFVDGFRTPHTTQEHVVERFRIVNSGKGLDISFTVDDPGTFYKPWGGRRPRFLAENKPLSEGETICAAGNEDRFNLGFDPLPHADLPDF